MVTRLVGPAAGTAAGPLVIKLGGRALDAAGGIAGFAADLRRLGRPVVLVHGGGVEVNDWCDKLHIDSTFEDGLRVTDEPTLAVATAVLAGLVNTRLVAGLLAGGIEAVGLSGVDARTLLAEPHPHADRLGHVGRVGRVEVGFLRELLAAGRVPVLATVAADRAGGLWNINADDAAAAVAAALGATSLVFLTDVPAVRLADGPVGTIDLDRAFELIRHPEVTGGMKPKIAAACRALEAGVGSAVITAWIADGDLARIEAASDRPVVDAAAAMPVDEAAAEPVAQAADVPNAVAMSPAVIPTDAELFAGVYPFPRLELVRGSGCRVVDAAGREYIDFVSGIAVNALGHADPGLAAAVAGQVSRLGHVSNLYGNRPARELAAQLLKLTGYDRVFLCNSGTEAVEAALKFTRLHARAAGRTSGVIVAFEGAFHGRTAFALSVTATPAYREPFGPLVPGIAFSPFNDAAAFDALIAAEAASGRPLDAVIIEPVQGEAGARVADPAFLQHLGRVTAAHGALLLFDEVQCGVGRSGTFLAAEQAGVKADITILAKGLGGGIPIGAVLIRSPLAALLEPGQHGTTFGGNPVAAAAAGHVLATIGAPGFMDTLRAAAAHLAAGLGDLVARHPALSETRGVGLLRALELHRDAGFDPADLIAAAREAGLLLCKGGGRSVRVLPPLTVATVDIDEALARLDAALRRLAPGNAPDRSASLAMAGKGDRS